MVYISCWYRLSPNFERKLKRRKLHCYMRNRAKIYRGKQYGWGGFSVAVFLCVNVILWISYACFSFRNPFFGNSYLRPGPCLRAVSFLWLFWKLRVEDASLNIYLLLWIEKRRFRKIYLDIFVFLKNQLINEVFSSYQFGFFFFLIAGITASLWYFLGQVDNWEIFPTLYFGVSRWEFLFSFNSIDLKPIFF